jgi:Zn-dependent peptidase ImmA (M78 family)/transposase-like protein
MRVGTPGFVPDRLTIARAARRIVSKSELARRLGVNPSSVTRWEEEHSSAPDAAALTALATELRLRREYFLRPMYEFRRPVFLRSLSSTLKRDLDYQRAQMSWMLEISSILQHYVDFPNLDLPDVLGGAKYKQLRDEDIERIALDLRRHWRVGVGPCIDVVALLERVGFVVSSIEMGTAKLDGLCSWSSSDNRPHILLASDKMSFPRRQMDAAHEMAHALLHGDVTADELRQDLKVIEAQAFRLASAFLLPSTTYPPEVLRPSLANLLSLKERWRVSIKAQIKRLTDLEIVSEDHALQLYKLYSAKGWNRQEPLDQEWSVPEPRVMAEAFNAIVSSGVRTKADLLAVEFTMSPGDVENIANLPPGWFAQKSGEVVQLRSFGDREAPKPDTAATVLPFNRR